MTIYFTRYAHRKSIKMPRLHYYEWEKMKNMKEKKYLMVNVYMLDITYLTKLMKQLALQNLMILRF